MDYNPIPDKTIFKQYLDASGLECLEQVYSTLDYQYMWIGDDDSARIGCFKLMIEEPWKYGISFEHVAGAQQFHKPLEQVLPEDFSNIFLYKELSYTLLYGQFIQAALHGELEDRFEALEFCSDSTVASALAAALRSADPYAGLLGALPASIGSRLSWIGEFTDSADLDYPGFEIPDFKLDSLKAYAAVRSALQQMGLLSTVDSLVDSTSTLVALKIFQRRNGLEPDGLAGKLTREAFQKSNRERMEQLVANLDRARQQIDWEKTDMFVEVNIPEMTLRLYKDDQEISRHRIVVGKRKKHMTPVFMATMNEIVVNPEWVVPYSIATKEILPDQQADSNYIRDHHYMVYDRDKEEVDPDSIDWNILDEDYFPYRIVQKAGSFNALGTIKFLFPNEHLVYIHDTPSRSLFYRTQRDFSHGCIRIQDPYQFARRILQHSRTAVDSAMLATLLDTASVYSIPVYPRIPVHIIYHSVQKDDRDEFLIFYNDIYGLDESGSKDLVSSR